jgi:hypothetical protein
MNIAAKKMRVRQSMCLIILSLFWLNIRTGTAATSAMYVSLKSTWGATKPATILAITNVTIKNKESLERVASL